jgi:hypothetical protein
MPVCTLTIRQPKPAALIKARETVEAEIIAEKLRGKCWKREGQRIIGRLKIIRLNGY